MIPIVLHFIIWGYLIFKRKYRFSGEILSMLVVVSLILLMSSETLIGLFVEKNWEFVNRADLQTFTVGNSDFYALVGRGESSGQYFFFEEGSAIPQMAYNPGIHQAETAYVERYTAKYSTLIYLLSITLPDTKAEMYLPDLEMIAESK